MKNILKITLPALSALALFSCGVTTNSSNPSGDTPTSSDSSPGTNNVATHDIYAFEAATGLPLLSELGSSAQALGLARLNAAAPETIVTQIKDYLPTVESVLLDGKELIKTEELTSDKAEYEHMIRVTYTDIALESESFTMYFNETLLNDIDDDDDDDDWDDRYENDKETETKITGIITFGENTYNIYGEKEIEGNEVEVEFFYQIAEGTYAQIKQEKETGETEFEYTLYENGRKVYDYSLSVENNRVDLEVKDRATLTDLEMEFTLFEREGTTYIKAEVEDKDNDYDDILFRKVIDEVAGTSTYEVVE